MKNQISKLIIAVILCVPTCIQAANKPNIILLLTDDQGYGDTSGNGHPVLKTPNFDKLQSGGVSFKDFSVSPTCAPTRCALMTGMHEFKSGVTHTKKPWRYMNLKSVTVGQVLKDAGYATGIFGKWHLGLDSGYAPHERGFDSSFVVKGDSQQSHWDPMMLRNGEPEKTSGFRTDILFDEAISFIEKNKKAPFFCHLATYSPHTPLGCPKEFSAPYKGKGPTGFFGMIANIDYNLGRLLKRLDELELTEKTLIICINDNGATMGTDTYNAGMRGAKSSCWRGGTRAFSFWYWPGTLKPATVEEMTAHIDVFPTLAELAGCKLAGETADKLDGISLVPLLQGKKKGRSHYDDRMIFTHRARWESYADWHKDTSVSVRFKKYALISQPWDCGHENCRSCQYVSNRTHIIYTRNYEKHYGKTKGWELYDLAADPGQERNVADEKPEIREKMKAAYDQWWQEVRPLMINERPPPKEKQ